MSLPATTLAEKLIRLSEFSPIPYSLLFIDLTNLEQQGAKNKYDSKEQIKTVYPVCDSQKHLLDLHPENQGESTVHTEPPRPVHILEEVHSLR